MSGWKQRIGRVVRRIVPLAMVDYASYLWQVAKCRRANRRFLATLGHFPVPPRALAFDAYSHVDWRVYYETGRRHAQFFAELIGRHLPPGPLRICEWGCGPARVIRHLGGLLGDRPVELVGCDYNPRSIAWCRAQLAGIDFRQNALLPPLPLAAGWADAIYGLSVFTHLSEESQVLWMAELLRVVKDAGIVIFTTHGDAYRGYLEPDELARYEAGQVVVRGRGGREGKKAFSAFHPPAFVRDRLLAGATLIAHFPSPRSHGFLQDCWVVRRKC